MIDNENLNEIDELYKHIELTRNMLIEKGMNISIGVSKDSVLEKMENEMYNAMTQGQTQSARNNNTKDDANENK